MTARARVLVGEEENYWTFLRARLSMFSKRKVKQRLCTG